MRGPQVTKTRRARQLRAVENNAEDVVWSELRNRRLNGYKFVRQFPIGRYFADFACREHMLVLEIDGSQHADNPRDRVRDDFMTSEGWSVLRLWNADVLSAREAVLDTILAAVEGKMERTDVAELRFLPGVSRRAT